MDTRVFAVGERLRVREALALARRAPRRVHDYLFVVDDEHHLIGVIGLRELATARSADAIASVMNGSVMAVPASASRAVLLNHPGWMRFHTLPVVDDASVLVGAIGHTIVRALVEEEALTGALGRDAAATIFALGELYWLGLSSLLDGVATAVRDGFQRASEEAEATRGRE
jgi:magnesium transporter